MRYVIIGNGAAGNAAAAAIRERDPGGEVLIFSDEPQPAYYRPLIVNLIAADSIKDLYFPAGRVRPGDTELHLGNCVMDLDPRLKRVTLQNEATWAYDRLLLATGASAILPPISGLPGPGTQVLRTLADAQSIAQTAAEAKTAVIIGAGRVGLKAALALHHRGLQVTLVEQGSHLAPMQFDETAGAILGQALQAAGFRLYFGQTVTAVARAHGRIQSVNLADGRELPADMVIAAVGVRPRTELARQAGLAVNQGILVDKYLCTSDPDIYAAGDAVETTDLVTSQSLVSGLWTNAVEMGRLTGNNMAGANLAYPGAFGVLNSFEVAGIPTMAIGVTNPPAEEGYRVYSRRRGPDYRKLVCQDEVLVGALLVGDIADGGVYAGLIRGKAKVGAIAEALEHPRAGLASRLFSRIAK